MRSSRSSIAAVVLVLAAATFFLYAPTLKSDFVYDARAQVLMEDFIHRPAHVVDVVTLRVLGMDVIDRTRPANLLTLIADAALWSRNPAGYHLTNILLHMAAVVLLFLFLVQLSAIRVVDSLGRSSSVSTSAELAPSGSMPGLHRVVVPGLVALLFAVHPVATESVCEVSYREDLLVAIFTLVGLLALGSDGAGRRSGWRIATVVVSSLLAVCSKESGLAAPFILLGYGVVYPEKRTRTWRWAAPASLALALMYLAAAKISAPASSEIFVHRPTILGGSYAKMLTIQPRIWAFQLQLIAWPTALCADQGPDTIAHLRLGASLACLAVFWGLVGWIAWRLPAARLGVIAYWAGLLPVSNLVPMYREVGDRFLYVPLLGVAILATAVGVVWLGAGRYSKRAAAGLGVGVLLLCIPLATINRGRQAAWATPLALWGDTLARNPGSMTAINSYGMALFDAGQYAEAAAVWQRATRARQDLSVPSQVRLAIALEAAGSAAEADEAYQTAVRLDTHYGHGVIRNSSNALRPTEVGILNRLAARAAAREAEEGGR